MQYRYIGDIEVSAIGFGAMGFSHGYGPGCDENTAIDLMRTAYDMGCTFFDTAEVYGAGENEKLVGKALAPMRDKVVIATKFLMREKDPHIDLKQEIPARLEASLQRLGVDYVDIYYQHRVPDSIPVEEVADIMGTLITAGKIRGWGQSQSSAQQIRAAHAITPLTAVQSEYSIMERKFEENEIPTCQELGIGFVAFSPLASGFLSGKYTVNDTFTGDDVRRVVSRFDKENMLKNQPLLDYLTDIARSKGVTVAQISLAWMLHKSNTIVPIPGMRTLERVQENLAAAQVVLTNKESRELEDMLKTIEIHGNRTDEDIAKLRNLHG